MPGERSGVRARCVRRGPRVRVVFRMFVATSLVIGGAAGPAGPASALGSWSIMSSPSPNPTDLASVACSSPTNCFAVGNLRGAKDRPLVKRWDGTSWSIMPSAHRAKSSHLSAVTCESATSCFAVGVSDDDDGAFHETFAEHWNGTSWSLMPNPEPVGRVSVLLGVACPTVRSCFVVGNSTNGATDKALVEHWNGSSWSIVNSPHRRGRGDDLAGVSCPGPQRCFAVGYSGTGPTRKTLVERWEGTRWSIVSNPYHTNARLSAVSCPSITSCFAVGVYGPLSNHTLVEHWNGAGWSIMNSPNRDLNSADSTGGVLNGVACASITNCFAVGRSSWDTQFCHPHSYGFCRRIHWSRTLVQRWDGTKWSIVNSPNRDVTRFVGVNEFSGVACAARCIAVGHTKGADLNPATLVERYSDQVAAPTYTVTSHFHQKEYHPGFHVTGTVFPNSSVGKIVLDMRWGNHWHQASGVEARLNLRAGYDLAFRPQTPGWKTYRVVWLHNGLRTAGPSRRLLPNFPVHRLGG